MTGGGEQKENEERGDAKRLEREADELAIIPPGGEFGDDVRQRVLHCIPFNHEPDVHAHDQKGQHTEMAPVVKKRQETAIEPASGPIDRMTVSIRKAQLPNALHADIDRVRYVPGRMERRMQW